MRIPYALTIHRSVSSERIHPYRTNAYLKELTSQLLRSSGGDLMIPQSARPATPYRYFVVFMLGLVYAFNFLDRQLLAVLAEPVKQELLLSDTQLGVLTGLVFAVFYTSVGLPVAWLADRSNRVRIVAAACALWSIFTAASGFASNFAQLAAARIGIGIGEAGSSAPSHSVIADYFPRDRRAAAMALFSLGVPVGSSVGVMVGGWIADVHGWRMAFMGIGISGVILALLVAFLVREPVRGQVDGFAPAAATRTPLLPTISAMFQMPILRRLMTAASLSAFAGYGMLSWVPALLMRSKGMSMSDLALLYGSVSGIASILGTAASGFIVDHFARRSPRAYALVPAIAFLIAGPFLLAAIWVSDWRMSLALLIVPFLMYATYLPPALALVQNVVEPQRRAASAATLLFMMNLIGLGGGPLLVGMISDWAAANHGKDSLTVGLSFLTPFFIAAAFAHFRLSRCMRRELATLGEASTLES